MKTNLKAITLILLMLFSGVLRSEPLYVAVASNFLLTARKIAVQFEKRHQAVKVELIPGSSGKIYSQIINGAPFHVFMSADKKSPKQLAEKRPNLWSVPKLYAVGQLAFWFPAGFKDLSSVLKSAALHRFAMPQPKLAPYGQAAQTFLEQEKLISKIKSKIVFTSNVSQAYQFVASKNVQGGFVSLSHLMLHNIPRKEWKLIVTRTPIEQWAVGLKSSKNSLARKWLAFLDEPDVRALIRADGYLLPSQTLGLK